MNSNTQSKDLNSSAPALIIHELTLLQERLGYLPESELRELALRINVPLHRIESVSTFYTHFRRQEPKKVVIECCRDLSCKMAGGHEAINSLKSKHAASQEVEIHEVSCLGRCELGAAAFVGPELVDLNDSSQVESSIQATNSNSAKAYSRSSDASRWQADIYASAEERYRTIRSAVAEKRTDLASSLQESGLRGMGGAGFPTGLKWSLVAKEKEPTKYIVCNADESEPGTFKDREILLDLPHLVIEGMMLAAYTVGAKRGWVFIRHEYGAEREHLQKAIDQAYADGVLGKKLGDSDFSFDLDVFVSPGGYILGEETALLECMEDKRGEPRNKPPFPGNVGLFGKPTIINNVETFAHSVGICGKGVEWWNGLGKGDFAGHKFLSVSGDVEKPGVYLLPTGTPLRELLEICGGMKDGQELLAIAPGGASSNFLPASALDTPLDFATLQEAGSMLGSGAVVFVAKGRDLLDLGRNITTFFRNESCGKCVPCRVGTEKAVELLEGKSSLASSESAVLKELHETLGQTSICGLGQIALGPVLSIVDNFADQDNGK